MSEWISVKQDHPKRNTICRVKTKNSNKERIATYFPSYYKDGFMESLGFCWIFEDHVKGDDFCEITHWIPFPKVPNE